jgi:hypothetical protein
MRRKHLLNVAGVIAAFALALCMFFFGIWQLDLIVSGPVWSYGWKAPAPRYADQYFQCFLWKTSIGRAYDTLFLILFLSVLLPLLLLFVSLWTWEED